MLAAVHVYAMRLSRAFRDNVSDRAEDVKKIYRQTWQRSFSVHSIVEEKIKEVCIHCFLQLEFLLVVRRCDHGRVCDFVVNGCVAQNEMQVSKRI